MAKEPLFLICFWDIDRYEKWENKNGLVWMQQIQQAKKNQKKKHWCAWNSLILAIQNTTLVDTGLPGLLNFRFHLSMVGFVKNLRLLRVYSIINFAKRYTANIYRDLRGSRRFSLQYLWKRAVRITEKS